MLCVDGRTVLVRCQQILDYLDHALKKVVSLCWIGVVHIVRVVSIDQKNLHQPSDHIHRTVVPTIVAIIP